MVTVSFDVVPTVLPVEEPRPILVPRLGPRGQNGTLAEWLTFTLSVHVVLSWTPQLLWMLAKGLRPAVEPVLPQNDFVVRKCFADEHDCVFLILIEGYTVDQLLDALLRELFGEIRCDIRYDSHGTEAYVAETRVLVKEVEGGSPVI